MARGRQIFADRKSMEGGSPRPRAARGDRRILAQRSSAPSTALDRKRRVGHRGVRPLDRAGRSQSVLAVALAFSERHHRQAEDVHPASGADPAHARAPCRARLAARPRARGTVLARVAPSLDPEHALRARSSGPVHTARVLGHGAALRRGARTVLGGRSPVRDHLQLVDEAHAIARRSGARARDDEFCPLHVRHRE